MHQIVHARELFWNNVMREILTALSVLTVADGEAQNAAQPAPDASAPEPDGEEVVSNPLDGRLAIVTRGGERIPIAAVYPLFACGIPGPESERALSIALECTVFQIRTPSGEVYTLPLHEIRGFHALSQALMDELAASMPGGSDGTTGEPFGFAAFTSLARSGGNVQHRADAAPNPPGMMEPGI